MILRNYMYKPVETNLNFVDREKEVLEFWKQEDIFRKSVEKTKVIPNSVFTTDRRPQTANPT